MSTAVKDNRKLLYAFNNIYYLYCDNFKTSIALIFIIFKDSN